MIKKITEYIIEKFLFFSTLLTVAITIGIVSVFAFETFAFFKEVSIVDFFIDLQWTPLFPEKHFGILPLLCGTLLTTFIAISFALPIGLSISIYLSEYASNSFRKTIKPLLELLAFVPSIVYGFFALIVLTPFLQNFYPNLAGFNSLSAGIVMGIMIIPYISSLSEDSLHSVPKSLREASLGMGATKLQTAFNVIVPSASSGIIASIILAVSRAIGETMIVTIAAGQQPRLTLNPTVPIETITSYIVQVSLGDVEHDSLEYRTIFAVGITLFIFTLILNTISYRVRKK